MRISDWSSDVCSSDLSRKREAGVDLNQLLYHHQIALMAVSQARRDGHLLPGFDLPRYYAKRISEYRERRGLTDGFAAMIEQTGDSPRADPPIGEGGERADRSERASWRERVRQYGEIWGVGGSLKKKSKKKQTRKK